MNTILLSSLNSSDTSLTSKKFAKSLVRSAILVSFFFAFQQVANAQVNSTQIYVDTIGQAVVTTGSGHNQHTTTTAISNTPSSHVPSAYKQFLTTNTSDAAPQDGYYAVTYSTSSVSAGGGGGHSFCWWQLGWQCGLMDHTTNNGTGYYLLINGDTSHVFYQATVPVSNTTAALTVSFWVQSVIDKSASGTYLKPNFNMVVRKGSNGAVMATSAPADLPQDNAWHKYTFNLAAQGQSNIVIQLLDNQHSGVGNDFALDDIAVDSKNCVPPDAPAWSIVSGVIQPTCATSTGSVTFNNLPNDGTIWTLAASASSPMADTVKSSGATATINGLIPGTYNFTVTNSTGCISVSSGNIVIAAALPPSQPTLVGTITQPTCITASSITVISTLGAGTTGTLMYSLDGGTAQTSGTFTGIAGGSHNIVATNGSLCTSTPYIFSINYPTYVWSGATSTVPTLASNWVGGIAPPFDGLESVTVPVVGTGKYPVLTTDGLSVFNLNITGATAVFNLNGHIFNVGCNILNSTAGGSVTYNSSLASTINWNGSTAQKYTGNGTVAAGTATFGNMTVNNSGASTVTIYNGPVDIYNALTLTKGSLAVDGTGFLTLKSSKTQTAYVSAITSGSITGNVNVERYLSGGAVGSGYRGYRLLSSPVWTYNPSTAPTVNCYSLKYLNTTVGSNPGALTGGPGSGNNLNSNGFTITNPAGNPTIYLYDESKMSYAGNFVSGKNIGLTWINTASVVIVGNPSTTSTYVPVGNGYIFYFIGNNSSLAYANTRPIDPTTITATGALNQGNIQVHLWNNIASTNLSFTKNTGTSTVIAGNAVPGLNQVGNPYASTISLDQLYTDNTTGTHPSNNIDNTFYELKEPGQNYIAYKAGGLTQSSFASPYIASGQGFLVAALSASSTLTFSENEKVATQLIPPTSPSTATSPALLLSVKHVSGTALSGMHLQLLKDSLTATQTGIYFGKTGSDTFNTTQDAIDLDGISPAVYLSSYKSDGTRVSINDLPDFTIGKRVKLFVKTTTTGQFHFGLADIKNIDTIYNVFLVDKLLKDSVDLRNVKTYDFNISTGDTTTFGANRFELALSLKQLPPYTLLSFKGQKSNTGVQLAWKTANEGDYTGFTVEKLSGTKFVALDSLQSSSIATYSLTDSHPVGGVNTYRLKQNGITGQITYSSAVLVNYNNLNSSDVLSVFPNPARSSINVSVNLLPGTFNLNIYNSMGALVKSTSLNGSYWTQDVSSYTPGTYVVEMHDSKGVFIGKAKFVKVQ